MHAGNLQYLLIHFFDKYLIPDIRLNQDFSCVKPSFEKRLVLFRGLGQ